MYSNKLTMTTHTRTHARHQTTLNSHFPGNQSKLTLAYAYQTILHLILLQQELQEVVVVTTETKLHSNH